MFGTDQVIVEFWPPGMIAGLFTALMVPALVLALTASKPKQLLVVTIHEVPDAVEVVSRMKLPDTVEALNCALLVNAA